MAALVLSDEERAELTSLAARRNPFSLGAAGADGGTIG
jgi:hypothetical protein